MIKLYVVGIDKG